jgi:hypothetical protein
MSDVVILSFEHQVYMINGGSVKNNSTRFNSDLDPESFKKIFGKEEDAEWKRLLQERMNVHGDGHDDAKDFWTDLRHLTKYPNLDEKVVIGIMAK